MAYMGIIPDAPSFGTQLARGLGGGLGQGLANSAEFAQKMALEKQKSHSLANQTKQLEKVKMLETGLGTIDRMRELIPSTGPSNWLKSLMGGETRTQRAEFEQLGKSLIPLVSAGVSIRNQKEFEEYKKTITDPNARQEDIEGALNGLQNLLERETEGQSGEESPRAKRSSMGKFDLSNPQHKARRDQVLKKTGGDRKKAEMVLSQEFEL